MMTDILVNYEKHLLSTKNETSQIQIQVSHLGASKHF